MRTTMPTNTMTLANQCSLRHADSVSKYRPPGRFGHSEGYGRRPARISLAACSRFDAVRRSTRRVRAIASVS
jgi:hypothetical protein